MSVIDLVTCEVNGQFVAWKYPGNELSTWTQLIVPEYLDAFVVKNGIYDGPFPPGRHTLETKNIPGLTTLIGLPFGGKSPFQAQVWYVNRTYKLDLKWGTSDPVQIQDPKYGVLLDLRSYGQYGVRIGDAKRFLLSLVGGSNFFGYEEVKRIFHSAILGKIRTAIAHSISKNKISFFEIATNLPNIEKEIHSGLASDLIDYGLELVYFKVASINCDEEDPSYQKLKEALNSKAEMDLLGFTYSQQRSYDVLEGAAKNTGVGGDLTSAGVGLGIGAAISPVIRSQFDGLNVQGKAEVKSVDFDKKIKILEKLKKLHESGVLSDAEFEEQKSRVLQ